MLPIKHFRSFKELDKFLDKHCGKIKEEKPATPDNRRSGNRYVSKVDWDSERVRNQITTLRYMDWSLTKIANHLGVTRSALSKANKKYKLYFPKC